MTIIRLVPHGRKQADWGNIKTGAGCAPSIARIVQDGELAEGMGKKGRVRVKSAEDSAYRWTRLWVRP
jgi:hypothetical protein